ncbi:SMI1/KNR4 family protein [Streptomyces lavendulocolor]|uniref:SMI1/KNR4 family protein n=1 Tax=Streptomyces lavendulocolor TaxID=67316 RepID=A0ABV2W2V0_9ACTN
MEDVIERIRAAHYPDWPLMDLPDEEGLARLEREHGLTLPAGLREFLLRVGDVVCDGPAPVTVTDPLLDTHLPGLTELAWEQGVPRDLVVLCQDEHLFYLVAPDGTVVVWSCDTYGLTEDRWESVWHWAGEVWVPAA